MESVLNRITISDEICNGKPTIRGYRITVQTILEFLFNGSSEQEILDNYPMLEAEDLIACKQFALLLTKNEFHLEDFAA